MRNQRFFDLLFNLKLGVFPDRDLSAYPRYVADAVGDAIDKLPPDPTIPNQSVGPDDFTSPLLPPHPEFWVECKTIKPEGVLFRGAHVCVVKPEMAIWKKSEDLRIAGTGVQYSMITFCARFPPAHIRHVAGLYSSTRAIALVNVTDSGRLLGHLSEIDLLVADGTHLPYQKIFPEHPPDVTAHHVPLVLKVIDVLNSGRGRVRLRKPSPAALREAKESGQTIHPYNEIRLARVSGGKIKNPKEFKLI